MIEEEMNVNSLGNKYCSNCKKWTPTDDIKETKWVPEKWGKCSKFNNYSSVKTFCIYWEAKDETQK